MVIPNPDSKPFEVHDAEGHIIAYLVPAEALHRLQSELTSLREQLAHAVQQRDHHLAKLENLLKQWFPLPPTEEEMLGAVPNSDEVAKIIAELESH